MDITIRTARTDDAPFLARVMLMASRSHMTYGLWDHFVGGTEQDCASFLERIAVTETPHLFHHDVFLIAERDGEKVAGLSGYDPVSHGMKIFYRIIPDVCKESGWTDEDLKVASRRMSSYAACMPEEIPGIWSVESVAAMPPARRQGIVSRLLIEIIAKGRAEGYAKGQISVLTSNTAARMAYEKVGFHSVDEKRDPAFEATYGDYGITRMIMDLR